MSLSLTNRDDIIANSYSLITSDGVVDLLDAVQSSVVGLPPSTLNTLEKLSAAISNDPTYFSTMQAAVNAKANASTTYTKDDVNAFLLGKTDDAELTSAVGAINASIGTVSATVAAVAAAVGVKADTSTTYTKTAVDTLLLGKTDDAELTTAVGALNASISMVLRVRGLRCCLVHVALV